MTLDVRLAEHGLIVLGGLHDNGTLLLIGPDEPVFWDVLTASPEYQDGQPNPVDRWSTRVITQIAVAEGAEPLFPFGGPPYHPFIRWALETGSFHMAPVPLLVHETRGQFASFRGALRYETLRDLPPPVANPCDTCVEKPCLSACPVSALTDAAYDVPACHDFLDSAAGQDCLETGCAVRRSCPVGQGRRQAAQSALHMRAFHRG